MNLWMSQEYRKKKSVEGECTLHRGPRSLLTCDCSRPFKEFWGI